MRLVEGPAVAPSFAEGLAHWLGWTDAIALSGALHAPLTATPGAGHAVTSHPGRSDSAEAAAAAFEREFFRVRTSLARAIADPNEPPAAEAEFAPYRRHCIALQQAMEAGIGLLRTQARAALARQSPAMGRLAAIDAVMEDVLGPHEHKLLARMPTLLARHFERLGKAGHETFRQDMQQLLLAELELRLQPVQGLLDALGKIPRIP